MNDCVAGGANGNEVINWIDRVATPDRSKGNDVMDMNESFSDFAKFFPEINVTNFALMTVVGNTSCARQRIAFIGVHNNFPLCTFGKSGRYRREWSS